MIQTVTLLAARAIAQALSTSAEISFTRCEIGDGVFDPETDDPREMTSLISAVDDASITLVREELSGVGVVADMDNTGIPGGTAIREMGLYAKVNDGDEFLFAYAYDTNPEIVPPPEESTYERRFVSHIAMTDDEVEIIVRYSRYEHVHSTTDITSGIFPIERGGTGAGTAAGALLSLGAAAADDLDEAEQAIADNASAIATLRESVSQTKTYAAGNILSSAASGVTLASNSYAVKRGGMVYISALFNLTSAYTAGANLNLGVLSNELRPLGTEFLPMWSGGMYAYVDVNGEIHFRCDSNIASGGSTGWIRASFMAATV